MLMQANLLKNSTIFFASWVPFKIFYKMFES